MRITLLAIIAAMSIQTGFVHTMQEEQPSKSSMTVKDFIIAGTLAGLAIEGTNWVIREERYKNIFRFMRRYPGFAVAGTTGVVGSAVLYGAPVIAQAKNLYNLTFGDYHNHGE